MKKSRFYFLLADFAAFHKALIMTVLIHQSKLALKKPFSSSIISLSQTAIICFRIILLLTYLVLKPRFLAKNKLCFIHGIKLLSKKIRLSNDIILNKHTTLKIYSSDCQTLSILMDGLYEYWAKVKSTFSFAWSQANNFDVMNVLS